MSTIENIGVYRFIALLLWKARKGWEGMDLHATRYAFEHKVLPHWFYKETKMFINAVLSDKNFLYDMLRDMCRSDQVEIPYQKEQFSVLPFKVTDGVYGVELTMPKPEEVPLCYSMYLMFQEDYEKCFYFTVEKGNEDGNDGNPFLCGWNQEECHVNFGNCGFDSKENMIHCSAIFIKNSYIFSLEDKVYHEV